MSLDLIFVYLPIHIDHSHFLFLRLFWILCDVVFHLISVKWLPAVATALRGRLDIVLFLGDSFAVERLIIVDF
jgi:hypothetical protein